MEQEMIKLMQVLELVEVTLQNGNDIKPDSLIIRNAVRQCLGMEVINLVEWLEEKLIDHLDISKRYKKELFDEAKQLENEIIQNEQLKAYRNGYSDGQKSITFK